jgi:hypothetical protein
MKIKVAVPSQVTNIKGQNVKGSIGDFNECTARC